MVIFVITFFCGYIGHKYVFLKDHGFAFHCEGICTQATDCGNPCLIFHSRSSENNPKNNIINLLVYAFEVVYVLVVAVLLMCLFFVVVVVAVGGGVLVVHV